VTRSKRSSSATLTSPGGKKKAAPKKAAARGKSRAGAAKKTSKKDTNAPWWGSPGGEATLWQGDSLERMRSMDAESIDVIFADPPYFLSNGGSTCKNGKRVAVDKGAWDKSQGPDQNHEFNRRWLEACRHLLTKDGTIWVSGTHHVIFSVGFAMQQLGFKILNQVTWQKPNPPPNLSCRYFTHSTETLLWARRETKGKHYFDYPTMREINGGKQMKDVWNYTAPPKREKAHGKHPTQKPLGLLERLLTASCREGARVLDPFNGSGTTGVAAASLNLNYTGLEMNPEYLELTKARLLDVRPEWAKTGKLRKVG
jgi:site-specific DNA-methyltransferase (adenine-specific)